MSVLTFDFFFHGTSTKQSKYDLTTEASADDGDICLNLVNSFFAFFNASLGIPTVLIFSSSASSSSPSSPISPSSF